MPIEKKLESKDFGINKQQVKSLPDYVMHIVSIGGGSTAELARTAQSAYAVFATSPTTDGYLLNYDRDGDGGKAPDFLFADEDILNNCPKHLIAAGHGILFSQSMAAFDRAYLALNSGADFTFKIENGYTKVLSPVQLLKELIILGEWNKNQSEAAVETLAKVCYLADNSRLIGEYSFISAYILHLLYKSYLDKKTTNVLLPADRVKTLKLLENKCGISYANCLKSIDFLPTNEYFRYDYIVNEYRSELVGLLDNISMHELQRKWRRVYEDAGFWLKSAFTVRELMGLTSLSGEIGRGLLTFIKRSGFLENYI